MSFKGDKFSYLNGIIIFVLVFVFLIVVFNGNVIVFIGFYVVGVFILFILF